MEEIQSNRQHSSKHEDASCYYADISNRQPPTYEAHAASRITGDILEVKSRKGAVGFVAIGRVRSSPNEPPHYHTTPTRSADQFHRLSLRDDVDQCTQPSRQLGYYVDSNHVSLHTRHHSEPALLEDKDIVPFNTSFPNGLQSGERTYETPARSANTPNVTESSSRHAKKSKKNRNPKSQSEVNSERKESSGHKTASSRNSSNATQIENKSPPADRERSANENREASAKAAMARAQSLANAFPLCKFCGQHHRISENHEYDYVEEVDDDLQCDICLQPFVDPYDTKCGHTFCSICLKNYVRIKKICPIDRNEINFACPGSVIRCPFSMFGCSFKGPREKEKAHEKKCKFQHLKGDPVDNLYPDCAKHTVELFRPEGIAELGIAIIGGNDTPIRNIIVQGIIPGSLVAEDGRIHAGDIIIDVNGEDLHNASHVEARTVLSRSSRLMRFTLLREKSSDSLDNSHLDAATTKKLAISLLKPPSEQLGIKITTSDSGSPGIYVLELVPGKVAHSDGQLKVGDRILEIAHVDLWDGSPDLAARVIQGAGERVDIVVSRQVPGTISMIANPWATDKTLPRNASSNSTGGNLQSRSTSLKPAQSCSSLLTIPIPESQPMTTSYQEKVISLKKSPNESLGIIVAGGMTGVRGDLPVFVQDIQPMGVLGKDKRLKRGDLLIQVNGAELTGLSHSQAIGVLKDTAQHCKAVSLTAVELNYAGKEQDFALWEELSGVHHQRSRRTSLKENNWTSWTPSWKMWLAVPPRCRIPRDVVIKKGSKGGLGFSIVGGYNEKSSSSLPVFVKYVVPNSPAAAQGRIRCGDEIVAVNGSVASRMTHAEVVLALKTASSSVVVSIMSWPGSVH